MSLGLGEEHAFLLLSYAETAWGPDQAPAHCSGQFASVFPTQGKQLWEENVSQQLCSVKTSCTSRGEMLPDR